MQDILTRFRVMTTRLPNAEIYWLDSPHYLYQDVEQANAYLELMGSSEYTGAFHDPVRHLLKQYVFKMFAHVPKNPALLDFGPGYPDKSFPVVEFLADRGLEYIPIDTNRRFLDVATDAIRQRYSVLVSPQEILFEDVPQRVRNGMIGQSSAYRIALLGLTFMNYRPARILSLLKRSVGGRGMVVVATELFLPGSHPAEAYWHESVQLMNELAIRKLGYPMDSLRYFAIFERSRVEMGFVCTRTVSSTAVEFKLRAGTRIVTGISLRYTEDGFRRALQSSFPRVSMYCDELRRAAIGLAVVDEAHNGK